MTPLSLQHTTAALTTEVRALSALKESLACHSDLFEDRQLLADLAEGSTSIFEAVDRLLADDLDDDCLLVGIEGVLAAVQARQGRFMRRREARRAVLEQALMVLEVRRLERPLATLSLAHRPSALVIDDEGEIPTHYFLTKPVLDRRGLKAALEAGDEVNGAHLSNGVQSLSIRRR